MTYDQLLARVSAHRGVSSAGPLRPEGDTMRIRLYIILSITDHDLVAPNSCPLRDAATQRQIDFGAFATERTPYPDPRPPTFPAETT